MQVVEADRSLLICDDDKPFITRLARAMEQRGFSVTAVDSVGEGLRVVEGSPPAYAVVDMRLGDGNGLDVVQLLKVKVLLRQWSVQVRVRPLHDAGAPPWNQNEDVAHLPSQIPNCGVEVWAKRIQIQNAVVDAALALWRPGLKMPTHPPEHMGGAVGTLWPIVHTEAPVAGAGVLGQPLAVEANLPHGTGCKALEEKGQRWPTWYCCQVANAVRHDAVALPCLHVILDDLNFLNTSQCQRGCPTRARFVEMQPFLICAFMHKLVAPSEEPKQTPYSMDIPVKCEVSPSRQRG